VLCPDDFHCYSMSYVGVKPLAIGANPEGKLQASLTCQRS
jgi:hypothetical protein